jgi:hypothetical protein
MKKIFWTKKFLNPPGLPKKERPSFAEIIIEMLQDKKLTSEIR